MCKVYLRNAGFAMLVISILLVLPLASFKYGNLRLITSEEASLFYSMAVLYGKYLPVYMFSLVVYANIEAGIKEENAKWKRFRLVTPLSGYRYAFYKYAFTFLMTCLVLVVDLIYFTVFDALFGGSNRIGEFGIVLALQVMLVILETIMLVYGEFLQSFEKAGLAGALTMFAIVGIVGLVFRDKLVVLADFLQLDDGETMIKIDKLGQFLFPYALILFIVAYAVSIFAAGLVYERREK